MRGIKKAGYGNVYKDILSNPKLSLQAKGIYAYLSSFTGDQEYCFPSYDTMQKHLCISRASISKYLKELVAFGVVAINKRFTGSNQYFLTDLGDFKHDSSKYEPLPKVQNMNYDSSDNELPKVQNMNSIKNTSLRTDKKNTYSESFLNFWNEYHEITGKVKAECPKHETWKHWKKLTNTEKAKALDTIKAYSSTVQDKKYTVIARTYLAKKRFNDEYETSDITRKPQQALYTYKVGNSTKRHSDKKRWLRDRNNFLGNGYEEIKITA